jgi:molybdenum cofactor cytidylyltransferase
MGRPKMLLPFADSCIIEEVIRIAGRSAVERTFVVLGANSEAIKVKIRQYPVSMIENMDYKKGMLSSVQTGLRALPESARAAMILLGDQPMIDSSILDLMIEGYMKSSKRILVATFKGRRGHPLIFGSQYFKEVLDYPEQNSLKDLLENHPEDIQELETGNAEILRDIDTEKDYLTELNYLHKHD